MKREIRFKAWDKRNKCMIEDYSYVGMYGELNTVGFHSSAYSDENCLDLVLMQLTGLKDKHGDWIYEGHVLKMKSYYPGNFEYEDEDEVDRDYVGQVVILPSKGTCLKNPYWFDNLEEGFGYLNYSKPVSGRNSVIIGNIYENPELIHWPRKEGTLK